MQNTTMIDIKVNGVAQTLRVKDSWTLLQVLREKLKLFGTKCACGKGECGACTVLVNGNPILSCITLAVAVDGKEITTIEGLRIGDKLHPIQQAFIEHGAMQCGFCSPGMIISAKALLDKNPHADGEEIRAGINGNLCRCTGYDKIVKAILSSREMLDSR